MTELPISNSSAWKLKVEFFIPSLPYIFSLNLRILAANSCLLIAAIGLTTVLSNASMVQNSNVEQLESICDSNCCAIPWPMKSSQFLICFNFGCVENRIAQAEELDVLRSIYGEENCQISSTNQFCEVRITVVTFRRSVNVAATELGFLRYQQPIDMHLKLSAWI